MRRPLTLLLAAAAAAPLLASGPADASVYCGSFGPIRQAFGPMCAVKCFLNNPPEVDPGSRPPVHVPMAPCYFED